MLNWAATYGSIWAHPTTNKTTKKQSILLCRKHNLARPDATQKSIQWAIFVSTLKIKYRARRSD